MFPKEPFSMTNSTWLNYFFYLINEEWKSPIKGHQVSLQCGKNITLPLCPPLMHCVHYCFITVATTALFQLPERSLWDGKAQLTSGKLQHLSCSATRTCLTTRTDPSQETVDSDHFSKTQRNCFGVFLLFIFTQFNVILDRLCGAKIINVANCFLIWS